MVSTSVWSSSGTDYCISFPIESSDTSIFKRDLLDDKLLHFVKLTQQNWVEYGTNVELCVNPLTRHNVSNTITVKDWDVVEKYIFNNQEYFAGISLLPYSGDKLWDQAPFQEVLTTEELLSTYRTEGLFFASGLIVDGLHCFSNLWAACDSAIYNNVDVNDNNYVMKQDWINRLNKYAKRYFDNDINKAILCLKDVFLLHKWSKVTKNYEPVDFTTLNIKPKYTNIDELGAIACNGDQCEINF